MIRLLVVGLGGFLGAIARYSLSTFVQERYVGGFPVGTLTVNVLGCLLAGVLWSVADQRDLLSENARIFPGVGFLGSLTTFSTFGREAVLLVRDGDVGFAATSVAANLIAGLLAFVLGQTVGRLFG